MIQTLSVEWFDLRLQDVGMKCTLSSIQLDSYLHLHVSSEGLNLVMIPTFFLPHINNYSISLWYLIFMTR